MTTRNLGCAWPEEPPGPPLHSKEVFLSMAEWIHEAGAVNAPDGWRDPQTGLHHNVHAAFAIQMKRGGLPVDLGYEAERYLP